MATLTEADAREMWDTTFSGSNKTAIKAGGVKLTRAVRLAMLQSMENWYLSQAATVKSGIEAANGGPVANAAVKAIASGYLKWRLTRGG